MVIYENACLCIRSHVLLSVHVCLLPEEGAYRSNVMRQVKPVCRQHGHARKAVACSYFSVLLLCVTSKQSSTKHFYSSVFYVLMLFREWSHVDF